MAILAFVMLTLLILQRQGMTQAINTLTIISIVVGFVMSVLGLLISFLQWHHPQPTDQPEPPLHALPQTLTLDSTERSRPPDSQLVYKSNMLKTAQTSLQLHLQEAVISIGERLLTLNGCMDARGNWPNCNSGSWMPTVAS